jgi:hypothetical protein
MYQELADMACNRITAAITRQFLGERPIKALLDPYNHTGSTRHVRFNTSRADRWDTSGPPPKAAAEQTYCSTHDALAVLALLSSGSARLLNMEMNQPCLTEGV